ncbi:MAG: hypothetical protein LBK83_03145 [Treponema sp.]|jgi:hypothetical protein|nr:hypothetical protein [Treponema sp.]
MDTIEIGQLGILDIESVQEYSSLKKKKVNFKSGLPALKKLLVEKNRIKNMEAGKW